MAEELDTEQTVDPAVEQEARSMGWVPQEEWKGDSAQWVDADEFVRRGETVMPILRANNKKLMADLTALRRENASVAEQLRAVNASLKALRESAAEADEANAIAEQEELFAELKDAIREDDAERQAEVQRRLLKLGQRPAKRTDAEPPPSAPTVDPETQAFVTENPWYGKDLRRTSLMNGIAAEMRQGGSELTGRAFLDAVKEEVDKVLESTPARRSSKVEESRGGASGRAPSNGKAGRYAELPRDAREMCDRDMPARFPTKRYANADEYRRRWSELYFQQG